MLRRNRIVCIVILIVCILLFVGCKEIDEGKKEVIEEGYPLTIVDSYNREIIIEKEPMRIVSIAPNITETIFALGEGDRLVGRTDYCDYPEEVKDVESIGNLTAPNIEKIAEIGPDLVIASTHFKEDVLTKLEELNMKVIVLYGEESFEGVYEVIDKIGKVLNVENKSEEIISEMKAKVQNVTDKVKDAEKPEVYYVLGFGESGDFTAGQGTFIDKMINLAGGNNVARDTTGWQYSLEKLIEKNPDILICSKYFDAKQGIMNATGYKDLTAVKEGRLYEIDNNLIDRQGPRLADGLNELAKIIHPELFQ